jgi:hypothetical protein
LRRDESLIETTLNIMEKELNWPPGEKEIQKRTYLKEIF